MSKGNGSVEIAEARRDVEIAKADLRLRVQAAGETSKRVVQRVVGRMRPALLLIAGLGGLALAVGLYKLGRGRRRPNRWIMPKRPSLIGQVMRSVLTTLAARLAARVVAQMPLPQLREENPPAPVAHY